MPRCEMFGRLVVVEGKLKKDSQDEGYVLIRKHDGTSDSVRGFPTYERAREWAANQHKEFVTDHVGREER